jgi:hypothetical protein
LHNTLHKKDLGPPLQKLSKALPGFFLPEETCFQHTGSSAVEGTSQAVLGYSDQRKVPASLSLFLKGQKKTQLCCTEEKDLSTVPSVIFDLFPWPTGLRHRSEITEVLLYIKQSIAEDSGEIFVHFRD